MLDHLQQYYLQQMGVELWQLRECDNVRPLKQLALEVASCQRCPLHKSRTNVVFARGNPCADLMIIGEAPGFYEDKQGLPFVGKAGGLLNRMLQGIGLDEQSVYIANVLKCRPPDNRDPAADEIQMCRNYLVEQINLIQPALILALGRFAGQFLSGKSLTLHQLRTKIHHYEQIPFIVTYHPAYLLRNPRDKSRAYDDLLKVKGFLSSREVCPA